jgi:DNA-binding CsgD family transcriptional regulator
MGLIGRDRELDALEHLLAPPRDGMSAALVVRGEAGVGKTALLRHMTASANGFQVAAVSGYESEVDLGFATLHRLLLPLEDAEERLPGPQRDALGAAFGYRSAAPPDRFLVGLATLTLLTDVAASAPLLCVVDDAQWVDDASLSVLTFVARRLHADRVAMVFGVRDSGDDALAMDGLNELRVGALDAPHAQSLLEFAAGETFDQHVADRIVAETKGNPLAIVELAGELNAEQRAGAAPLPDPLPIGAELESRFLRRVRELPPDTQSILLLAAAEPGESAALWRAAEQLGINADDAIEPAVTANLIRARPDIEFRHPLVRSAVYHGAPVRDRRRAHRELATSMDAEHEADRRAWHLACAAIRPDAEVATALELAAERVRGRGGFFAEVKFLNRAAELTPDPDARARRLLAASQAAHAAGALNLAVGLLDQAERALSDDLGKAHATRLRGSIEPAVGQFRDGSAKVFAAARAFMPSDPALARETLLDAFTVHATAGRYSRGVTAQEIARFALTIPADDPSEPREMLLDGWATMLAGDYAAGAAVLRRAISALTERDEGGDESARWTLLGSLAARELWDDDAFHALNARNVQRLRELGALNTLQIALLSLAAGYVHRGQLAEADACYDEVRLLKHAIGGTSDLSDVVDLQLRAWRGCDDALRATADDIYEFSDAIGFGSGVCIAQLALSTLELSEGHYSLALDAARLALGEDNLGVDCRALADIVEAAARAGEDGEAKDAFDRLAPRLATSGTDWGLGVLARLNAVLALDDRAETWFEEAVERLGRTKVVTDLARTHLLYGEWLRRRKRPTEARSQLRIAHDLFTTIGANGYAERARVELLATGEHARRRTVETSHDLTAQEQHVARLAAVGATNREIAAQMFLSTSTVDYHLRKAFRKLDITSRRQLARAMQD